MFRTILSRALRGAAMLVAIPALALAVVSWVGIRNRILYAGVAFFLLWFIGPRISLYFLIWLGGALVGRLRRVVGSVSPRVQLTLSAGTSLIFFGVLAWVRSHSFSSALLADYLVGFCFTLWLFALILGTRNDVSSAYATGAKKLSGFSYTLYLTHFPALLLLRGLLDPQGNWQPDRQHVFYGLGIALLMFTFAYIVGECTEARTAIVRRCLLQPRVSRAKEVT